jgi:FtsZ-binding cell division protein ZapB
MDQEGRKRVHEALDRRLDQLASDFKGYSRSEIQESRSMDTREALQKRELADLYLQAAKWVDHISDLLGRIVRVEASHGD